MPIPNMSILSNNLLSSSPFNISGAYSFPIIHVYPYSYFLSSYNFLEQPKSILSYPLCTKILSNFKSRCIILYSYKDFMPFKI